MSEKAARYDVGQLQLEDGKYTFYIENHILKCYRYGEPWREFVGDKAVHALFDKTLALLDDLTASQEALPLLRRVTDSLSAFILDSTDPGTEALAAEYEARSYLLALRAKALGEGVKS